MGIYCMTGLPRNKSHHKGSSRRSSGHKAKGKKKGKKDKKDKKHKKDKDKDNKDGESDSDDANGEIPQHLVMGFLMGEIVEYFFKCVLILDKLNK